MAICPICSGASDGKRITFNGFDIYDLCIKCASYSVCLINPNVDIPVKENAIRWAEREIQNNAEKIYLANCLRSWKSCAEDYIAANKPDPIVFQQPAEEFNNVESNEIDFDATVRGFSTYNDIASVSEENNSLFENSILDVKKSDFFTADEPVILAQPVSLPVEDISSFSGASENSLPSHTPEAADESPDDSDRTQIFASAFSPVSVPAEEEQTVEEPPMVFEDLSSDSAFPTVGEEAPEEDISPDAKTDNSEIIEEFAAETFRKVFDEESSAEENTADTEADPEEESCEELFGAPVAEDITDEETEAEEICKETSENFTEAEPDIKDFLREISLTLRSINEKMEKIEKEISELRK